MQAQIKQLESCVEQKKIDEGMAIVQQCKIARLTGTQKNSVSDTDYIKILELAILLSVAAEDLEAMGRHMQQYLSTTSSGTATATTTPSPHMLGLHVMALLVQNRDAEFHAQLEQWHDNSTIMESPFLQFPVTLERKLMVGMYDQILHVSVPHPSYTFFLHYLQTNTVREAICDTLETSYATLPCSAAAALIGLPTNDKAVQDYIAEEREDWIVEGGTSTITFTPPTNEQDAILPAAEQWMQQTLQYAGEMEQIV